jgi:phosphoribosyl 1,2-cyclic phosphate phosphodiesterase
MWELIITGCGTSHGTPPWGLPEFWSEDPRDHRRRSGAILRKKHGPVILLDTGPDLLYQLRDPYKNWDGVRYPADCITRVDAVLLTHAHADHCHGINELRHINRLMKMTGIPVYGHGPHLDEVRDMFGYCFRDPHEAYHYGSPALQAEAVADFSRFVVAGLPVRTCPVSHGPSGRTTAYRIGDLAYVTDVKAIPEQSAELLAGVDLLVLGMLREQMHPTHCNWEEAEGFIRRLQPKQTLLVHMGYGVHYAEWERWLPAGVQLAWDGFSMPAPVL